MASGSMASGERPHIVLFNPDQWRGDVMGHLGDPGAVTPHLDASVAQDAVSFRWAFCQNPVCTPSRCSFMTGWYPHVRGHRTMFHMLRRDEPVLLKRLKEAGYFVWWGGKNDLVPGQYDVRDYCDVKYRSPVPTEANPHNWDEWRGDPAGDNWYSFYRGREIPTQRTEQYNAMLGRQRGFACPFYDEDWAMVLGAIEQIRHAPRDRPMCLYLPLIYPHPPYAVEDPYYTMIDPARVPERVPTPQDWSGKPRLLQGIYQRQRMQGWSEERWRELRRTYYGMAARVDHQYGLVLEALREAGIYDQTAVLFFSDHGDFTGDYGLVEKTQNTFEDCLTRVPFVLKPPASVAVRPGVREALVELIDMPATVEALAGLPPTYTHFGKSLLPLAAGEALEHRDAVFCEGGRIHGEAHCMEKGSSSSIDPQGLYWPRVNLQASEGPEHTKAAMCRTREYKYVRRLYESDELYDLRNDPGERHNRIADPALAEVRQALRERMLRWYMETCDVVPWEEDRRNFS